MEKKDPTIPKLNPIAKTYNKDGTRRLFSARAEIISFITGKKEGHTMDELLEFVHGLGLETERNGLKVRLSQWRHAGDNIPYLK